MPCLAILVLDTLLNIFENTEKVSLVSYLNVGCNEYALNVLKFNIMSVNIAMIITLPRRLYTRHKYHHC